MKYKVGDKVKIKTWERLVEEFGLDSNGDIEGKFHFSIGVEYYLNSLQNGRVLTIIGIEKSCADFIEDSYIMSGLGFCWDDSDIDRIVYDPKDAINSRFEILDI